MQDYKPNSHRFKEEQKSTSTTERRKVDKVVSGTAKVRKKSEIRKLADNFISEDIQNIKSYVVTEVLIPTIKNTIWDTFTNSLDMVLFGGTGRNRRNTTAGRVSYRNYYDQGSERSSDRARVGYSVDDIVLDSRGEAEEVLARMDELIDTYKMVRVADLYDLVGVTGNYTDNKYGWTNIRTAEVVRVRDGYKIKLPRALPID